MSYPFTLKPLEFFLEYSGTEDGEVLEYYTAWGIGDVEFMVCLEGDEWHVEFYMAKRGEIVSQKVSSREEGERVCMEKYYEYVSHFVTVEKE